MKEAFFIQVDIHEAIPKKCDVICVDIRYCFFEKFQKFYNIYDKNSLEPMKKAKELSTTPSGEDSGQTKRVKTEYRSFCIGNLPNRISL